MRFLTLLGLMVCLTARSAVYYVANWGSDADTGTATNHALLTPYYATQTKMAAGDSLFILAGNYDGTNTGNNWSAIYANGKYGTAANPFVVSNYPGHSVFFRTNSSLPDALDLKNCAYWKVFGITFTNASRMGEISSGTNCEVGWCNFLNTSTNTGSGVALVLTGPSQSNYVHDCVLSNTAAQFSDVTINPPEVYGESGRCLQIGTQYDSDDHCWYNRIENNTMSAGGHEVLDIASGYNIIRGNFIHNERWHRFSNNLASATSGERCVSLETKLHGRNIVESNRIQYAQETGSGDHGAAGITVDCGPGTNIIRFNQIIGCDDYGVEFYTKFYVPGQGTSSNKFYHNTLFEMGRIANTTTNKDGTTFDNRPYVGHIHYVLATNYFVNNIFSHGASNQWFNIPSNSVDSSISDWSKQYQAGNWTNRPPAEPSFTNTSLGDFSSQTIPDLHLLTNSTAIDSGAWLTTVTSAGGSGTSFVVADAGYFTDGFGVVAGDQIQLAGVTNVARITSIAYDTSTITFTPSLNWVKDQGIALPYNGVAPDAGAFEANISSGNPLILVTPASISFGTQAINASSTSTINVTNIGGGTLSWTASTATYPYTLSPTSGSLAAGVGQAVTLTFRDSTAEVSSDTATFTGGGGATVALSGTTTNFFSSVLSGAAKLSGSAVLK